MKDIFLACFQIFNRKWRKEQYVNKNEMALIQAMLPSSDPRTSKLLRQVEDAPYVERCLIAKNSYRLSIPYVKDNRNCIEAPYSTTSSPITISDLISERELTFSLSVLKGGFINNLIGVACDGRNWPMNWKIDIESLKSKQHGLKNWLPIQCTKQERLLIIQKLSRWLALDYEKLILLPDDFLVVRPPASKKEIHSIEEREKLTLPLSYKEFVEIANGLSIEHGRSYCILGIDDINVIQADHLKCPMLLITDLYEKGVVAMQYNHPNDGIAIFVDDGLVEREVIGDIKKHIKFSLEWAIELWETKNLR